MKEQKKKKRSVLIAESVYNSQNAQFGLVMPPLKMKNLLKLNNQMPINEKVDGMKLLSGADLGPGGGEVVERLLPPPLKSRTPCQPKGSFFGIIL